ncbi:hypothetical protein BJ165DRAFT_1616007 [Panaeolus papilionaceus]|nr:hypothetical protein BJ165DRAFT_1616007 [Panaeolus papilionaceus]
MVMHISHLDSKLQKTATDMGATSQELPFDLISQIILRLANDRQTLRTMALTCKLLSRDATKRLYNTYLLIKLRDRPRRDDPSRGFLTTITDNVQLATLIQSISLHFNGSENESLSICLSPAALEAMENLISLEVIHNSLRHHEEIFDEESVMRPFTALRAPRYRFRLKRLTWTSNAFPPLIRELSDVHEIMKKIVWGSSPGEPIATMHRPLASSPSRLWLLPSLRTVSCSPRALDIFSPIFNQHHLKDITIHRQFSLLGLHEPAVLPHLKHIGASHLTRLHLDFVTCTEFKLKDLTPYLSYLETIELHRPEVKLTANDIIPTFGCLENLRSLYITRKSITRNVLTKDGVDLVDIGFKIFMHNNMHNFAPRIFMCCPNLYQAQFEIQFKEDPGSIHYRRWRRSMTPVRGKGGLSSRSLDVAFRSSMSMGSGVPLIGEAGTLIA